MVLVLRKTKRAIHMQEIIQNNARLRYSDAIRSRGAIRSRRGTNARRRKNPGVFHPPKNRVKVDPEQAMVSGMYEGGGLQRHEWCDSH